MSFSKLPIGGILFSLFFNNSEQKKKNVFDKRAIPIFLSFAAFKCQQALPGNASTGVFFELG